MMVGSRPSNNIDSSKNLHEEARSNPANKRIGDESRQEAKRN